MGVDRLDTGYRITGLHGNCSRSGKYFTDYTMLEKVPDDMCCTGDAAIAFTRVMDAASENSAAIRSRSMHSAANSSTQL